MGMNTDAFSVTAAIKIARILGEKVEIKVEPVKEQINTPEKRKEFRLTHRSEYTTWCKIHKQSCDEWKNSFENFVDDMGRRPKKNMLLVRKNRIKSYSKKNCKWVSRDKTNYEKVYTHLDSRTHAKLKRMSKESGMTMSRCLAEIVKRSKCII